MGRFRPSVCIDAVFSEMSPSEALAAVAETGIEAFEFWGWWDRDLEAIEAGKKRHDFSISACCTKFISLVNPDCRNAYLQGLRDSIETATRIGCPTLISQVGDVVPGLTRTEQHQSLVDGLRQAAPMLEEAGITLVIEPLNELIDHPGYYLVRSNEAFQIIDKVDSPRVKVVYDIYHQQISEGQLIANLTANIDKIGHFHAAGNPGRNELTIGELHYPSIFEAIAETDYQGYVGLEYWPVNDPVTGLKEVAHWF
ncbi:MAG: TIM barrel protein [Planctomycetaceae bacterium]|nr:TIM barrel protein [Planctomycetaceae bacterium]